MPSLEGRAGPAHPGHAQSAVSAASTGPCVLCLEVIWSRTYTGLLWLLSWISLHSRSLVKWLVKDVFHGPAAGLPKGFPLARMQIIGAPSVSIRGGGIPPTPPALARSTQGLKVKDVTPSTRRKASVR